MTTTKEDTTKSKKEISKMKILYIEDDLEFAELIQHKLMGEGLEVAIATNATIATTLFRLFRPDILMVDLDLQTGIQGIDIIRKINSSHPFFPIIVYSAHVDTATVLETMKYGVMHHIGKDRSTTELVAILNNAIRQAYRYGENFNPEYHLSETTFYNIRSSLLSVNGKETHLSSIESKMLKQLCLHINEFVAPEELSTAMWEMKKTNEHLHRYIVEIRKMIEPYDSTIRIINRRGAFYKLECDIWNNTPT